MAPKAVTGLLPAGAEVRPASHLGQVATGSKKHTLLIGGAEELESEVYGDELLKAPVVGKPCLYWAVELFHETGDANHHVRTGSSGNGVYVRVGEAFVAANHVKFPPEPHFARTYNAGREPADFPLSAHPYPATTYHIWLLEPARAYRVRVERFVEALPPVEPDGGPTYKTFYHFTFRQHFGRTKGVSAARSEKSGRLRGASHRG